MEGGVDSIQGMKKKVREALGGEGVAYVDTRVGAPEAWIRLPRIVLNQGLSIVKLQVHGRRAG